VEKSESGSFPLRLEIARQQDFHFSHRCGTDDELCKFYGRAGDRKKVPTHLMFNLLMYSWNKLNQKRLAGDTSQDVRLPSSTVL
jgi:hypothetical protein